MNFLDPTLMKHLFFSDFEVEKMEYSPSAKKLKIYVSGAFLDIDDGIELGNGILLFEDWDAISIKRFDPLTEKWSSVEEINPEPLKDLCEVNFLDSTVSLCGFGKQIGHWLEWKIENAKMHAEFNS